MTAFLRFLALFAVLVAFLVLVALPLAAGPFLTQMVRDMGLRSDTLAVTVAMFDPLLVLGRSRSTHISAGDVDLSPAAVGSVELTLGDVSFFDRTWRTIDGEITDVAISTGGETFRVGSLEVSGPAGTATATARLNAPQAEALIREAAEHQGARVDDVTFNANAVSVTVNGSSGVSRLEVRGGALVLFPAGSESGIPLVQPAPADPWQLQEAWISAEGLNIRGTVDTTRLAEQFGAVNPPLAAE